MPQPIHTSRLVHPPNQHNQQTANRILIQSERPPVCVQVSAAVRRGERLGVWGFAGPACVIWCGGVLVLIIFVVNSIKPPNVAYTPPPHHPALFPLPSVPLIPPPHPKPLASGKLAIHPRLKSFASSHVGPISFLSCAHASFLSFAKCGETPRLQRHHLVPCDDIHQARDGIR
ncbi:hypothetical protein Hypma_004919 [Hypsizygus marmoreus]|uniref:Uncharacterized protein n=1 Tax=Hypsizygus marmoreus TaxID=39966 RepID=A0A369KBD8_HYPMA|nr:hypothetical protein Hypma_004919 [Hypsizygus marmoreus]